MHIFLRFYFSSYPLFSQINKENEIGGQYSHEICSSGIIFTTVLAFQRTLPAEVSSLAWLLTIGACEVVHQTCLLRGYFFFTPSEKAGRKQTNHATEKPSERLHKR